LKSVKHNIESLLYEVRDAIISLNVEESLGRFLLEDIELAGECFKEKNILSVNNCLAALVGKLQTYVLFTHGQHPEIERLLISIHHLQQSLIRLPVCIIGPTGATGPAGPAGPIGLMGATGPAGSQASGRTTTFIASSYPAYGLPITKTTGVEPSVVDLRSHIVT
jgi:hypothetical protein